MTYYGIYRITNLRNGKMYIGKHKTTDIDDGYMGSGTIIKNAVKKYGVENFHKEWLMFCEDEEEMNYMERVYVDQTWVERSDTYNLKLGGEGGGVSGRQKSDETRRKLSEALKGRPSWAKGKHFSEEHRTKISKAHRGKHKSEETRRKLSEAHRGKTLSEEHIRKMSESLKGKHCSEETRQKISDAHKGKTLSKEHRQKLSDVKKGKTFSEEHRQKIAEALKLYWRNKNV